MPVGVPRKVEGELGIEVETWLGKVIPKATSVSKAAEVFDAALQSYMVDKMADWDMTQVLVILARRLVDQSDIAVSQVRVARVPNKKNEGPLQRLRDLFWGNRVAAVGITPQMEATLQDAEAKFDAAFGLMRIAADFARSYKSSLKQENGRGGGGEEGKGLTESADILKDKA